VNPKPRSFLIVLNYFIGAGIVAFGVGGFFVEMGKRDPSGKFFSGFALAGTIIAIGLLLILSTRFRYMGGLWSSLGVFLVIFGFTGFATTLDNVRMGRRRAENGFLLAALLIVAGTFFLLLGHMRHRRKRNKAIVA
jgi:hypothetical protein